MNYADLFRVTLPETALEVAALVVLVVDLGFLRKAALKMRVAVAALLGVAGCGAALWALQLQGNDWFTLFSDSIGSGLLVAGSLREGCADRNSCPDGVDALVADRFGFHAGMSVSM